MLRGLQQLNHEIEETLHIPFFVFQGEAVGTIPSFVKECGASLLITDPFTTFVKEFGASLLK
ncbi:putative deoxyribodipyrimidine photo-lyase [Helianthus anomalus]